MKKILLQTTAILLILAGVIACGKEEKDGYIEIPQMNISTPIGDIVSIFELKYGETKKFTYNEQTIDFSINDVENNVLDCSVIDFISPEDIENIRVHVGLNINVGNKNSLTLVSSKTCGALAYINDGGDIQHVIDILQELLSAINPDYFTQEFPNYFGDRLLIQNTELQINMAKAYPSYDNGNKSLYKFIFILTKTK
ncbi:MAG: hypothetical protein LBP63_09070 [Prevotellaceae bacterium]|nr:hypothetical protein [Prevotellaceae bacterium]